MGGAATIAGALPQAGMCLADSLRLHDLSEVLRVSRGRRAVDAAAGLLGAASGFRGG